MGARTSAPDDVPDAIANDNIKARTGMANHNILLLICVFKVSPLWCVCALPVEEIPEPFDGLYHHEHAP
jgi:hypothetical protein